MELKTFFIYLALMAGSTYLIRAIPFAMVNKKIENQFIKSFLYYIPYAVLSVMTIPAIFYSTANKVSAFVGFLVAVCLSYFEKSLTKVAIAACVVVFIVEKLIVII